MPTERRTKSLNEMGNSLSAPPHWNLTLNTHRMMSKEVDAQLV